MKDIKVTLLRNDSPAQNRNKANVSRKTKSINEQQWSLNLTKKAEFLYNQLSDVKLNQIHMKYANLSRFKLICILYIELIILTNLCGIVENSIRTLPSKHIKQVVKNIDHTNEEDIKIQLTKA